MIKTPSNYKVDTGYNEFVRLHSSSIHFPDQKINFEEQEEHTIL